MSSKEKKLVALTVLLVIMLPVWVQCIVGVGVGVVAAMIVSVSMSKEVQG